MITNILLAASATLFPAKGNKDVPESERVKILSKFLSPKLDSVLTISNDQIKEIKAKTDAEILFGFIEVTPPKGFCFTITKSVDQSDELICKKTKVRFQVGQIDGETGELPWTIRTGPQDFGTRVSWKTPYRVARVIPSSKEFENDTENVFIRDCKVAHLPSGETKYEFFPFLSRKWSVVFPADMQKLPKASKEEIEEPKSRWKLSTRAGFEFSGQRFISSDGSMPPGRKESLCRFEKQTESRGARLECHYTSEYTYVYIPIACH